MFVPASELFQPLLAEVTHNETVDPSMTFHLPEHNVPDSPEEPPDWDRALSETRHDPSESEGSPERLRTEEPIGCVTASPASHGSFSQHQPCKSVLVLSPPTETTDVELSALSLSKLTLCDQTPAVVQPEVLLSNISQEAASEKGILEESEITLVSLTDTTLQDPEESFTEEGTWEGQKDQATEVMVHSLRS